MKHTILVVEDERKLNTMIADYLKALEYGVVSAYNGIDAVKLFREHGPDLVVLDLMLPGIDGIDVIRKIRESSSTPIIMLTARAEETDKLMGLDSGADDYMTKPFSMKELAARIRAVLRRVEDRGRAPGREGSVLSLGHLVMDVSKRSVTKRGEVLKLTSLQFDILKYFMEQPGRVITRGDILEEIQEYGSEGYERTVDVHIKNIRKIIEDNPGEPEFILTVWGVGYKLAEEVE